MSGSYWRWHRLHFALPLTPTFVQRLAYCYQSAQIETALKLSLLTMRNFGRKLVDKARSTLDIAHPSQPAPSGVTQIHPPSVQGVNISGNVIRELS